MVRTPMMERTEEIRSTMPKMRDCSSVSGIVCRTTPQVPSILDEINKPWMTRSFYVGCTRRSMEVTESSLHPSWKLLDMIQLGGG